MTPHHGVWLRTDARRRIRATLFESGDLEAAAAASSAPTPLVRLPGLAAALGVGDLRLKDESGRYGLSAFKIAGVRFAAARLLAERPDAATLVAATTGNHGRAVARVARERGLAARIYVPHDAEPRRIAALRAEGADVVITDAGYDEAVRLMAADAEANGWTVVSDAAWPGYEQIPRWIMIGYAGIFQETRAEWPDRPDVVIVQAGIGSLAGAAAAWLDATWPSDPPAFVVAEPAASACVQASLAARHRVTLPSVGPTTMAGLRCAEVSPLAWPVLDAVTSAAVAVTEEDNDAALARLARGADGDSPVVLGPSGACGIAALVRLMTDASCAPARAALGLRRDSRVLTIGTEGPVA